MSKEYKVEIKLNGKEVWSRNYVGQRWLKNTFATEYDALEYTVYLSKMLLAKRNRNV